MKSKGFAAGSVDGSNTRKAFSSMPSVRLFMPSIHAVRKNILLLPFSVLSDILFIFLYGFIVTGLIGKYLTHYLVQIGIESVKLQQESYTMMDIFLHESTKPLLLRAGMMTMLMIIAVYILFSLFHGISWRVCRKISGISAAGGEKAELSYPLAGYMKEFFKINLFWALFLIIYNLLAAARDFLSSTETASRGVTLSILAALFIYFTTISYAMIPRINGIHNIKWAFVSGIKNILAIIPAFIIIAIILASINLLMILALKISFILMILAGVLAFLPALSWCRVYILLLISGMQAKKI